ncbi:hypothetical protein GCM10025331_87100 [Actinoplanes utahensis]
MHSRRADGRDDRDGQGNRAGGVRFPVRGVAKATTPRDPAPPRQQYPNHGGNFPLKWSAEKRIYSGSFLG